MDTDNEGGTTMTMQELFGEPISVYTRAQAVEDGVLVDISEIAKEAGFTIPVAITRTAWGRYVEVPAGLDGLQDEQGRLWDVVWMLGCAIRGSRQAASSSEIRFELYVQNDKRGPRRTTLKAVCGPGDDGEPTIVVMLPEED